MSLSQAEFAEQFLGIDAAALTEAPEEQEEQLEAEAQPEVVTEEPAEAEADESPEAEVAEEEEEKPAIVLPFEAKAKDEAVDPALLADMVVTFKADGKSESLPLADIIRRAQSEPAVQRQARSASARLQELERAARELEADLETAREVALRMARDPDYYVELSGQIAAYDTPEARAERAEKQLAEERERSRRERESAARETAVTSFATEVVAPTLNAVIEDNPLVTEEELLGRFFTDTAKWTVNGVIDPQFHQELALYLRSDFKEFASQRQAQRAAQAEAAKKEARKAQLESQRIKNQTAQAAKPIGSVGGTRDETVRTTRPTTIKEAEKSALSALLGGLS